MKAALLLVDLQRDFLRDVRLAAVVEEARREAVRARAAGWPVIHVWTTVDSSGDDRMPHWRRSGKWDCVKGTPGHASPLTVEPGDHVVHKRFFSAFAGTELAALLASLGVDTLRIAGVQMQSCVRATVVDAYQRGFLVEMAVAAIGSDEPLHAAISRDYLTARAAVSVPADEENRETADVTAAAREAQKRWQKLPWTERAALLERFAGQIDVEDLASRITEAVHKPRELALAEARYATELVRAAVRRGPPPELSCGRHSRSRHRPRGVVAAITPWNNPAAIALGRIAPALLHGNAVVWKPSPLDGGISDHLAGLGAFMGALQVLHGGGATARQLMCDINTDAVTLTGSDAAGDSALAICAARRIPLQAELGGNNAAIVWGGEGLEEAVAEVVRGAFSFAGQRCTANRRLIVHAPMMGRVLEMVGGLIPPMPSVVSAESRSRIEALLERHGSAVLRGPAGLGPHDVPAAMVVATDPACEVVQVETFGPVLVVQPADDFDHALALCNGVRQGLAAALFSTDDVLRRRFLEEVRAGILKLGRSTVDADVEAPFGGWKSSGIGPPERGRWDADFYTAVQAVYG